VFSEPAPVMPVFDNSLGAPTAPPLMAGITSAPASAPTTTWPPVAVASRDIPAGDRCLAILDATGTSYKKLGAKNGIETPIEVTSDIGGVRYEPAAGQSLLCDCRFAVALHRVAPVLKSAGVSRVRFSGAYSYRMSRVGRLSLHAYGLAMDVHELTVNGTNLAVGRDFARGLGNGCASDAPALNQVACRLKSAGMFRELLTPDFNADHADHFHLGVEPLTNSPIGTRVAVKPKIALRDTRRGEKVERPATKPAKIAQVAKVETPPSEPVFVADDEDEEPALDELDPSLDEPELVLDDKPRKKTTKRARAAKSGEPKQPKNAPRDARPAEKRTEDDVASDSDASEKPKKKRKKRDKHASKPDERASEERVPEKQKKPTGDVVKKKKPRRSARAQGTGST
jgi:hypothetical protein